MVAHAILFIVLPLAVAWFAGVTAYLPPYSLLPAPKTEPVEPQFEPEVSAFLAQHSDAATGRRVVPGLPRDALVDRAAGLEGPAVHEVLSAQSPAARGNPPRE